MTDRASPLVKRIVAEGRGYAAAKGTSREAMSLGTVHGLLQAGVVLGFWTRKRADSAAELVRHAYRLDRIPDVLLRDRGIELMAARDVAAFLGVSTQRVYQLIREGRMPPASLTSGRTSYWERNEITSWPTWSGGTAGAGDVATPGGDDTAFPVDLTLWKGYDSSP